MTDALWEAMTGEAPGGDHEDEAEAEVALEAKVDKLYEHFVDEIAASEEEPEDEKKYDEDGDVADIHALHQAASINYIVKFKRPFYHCSSGDLLESTCLDVFILEIVMAIMERV